MENKILFWGPLDVSARTAEEIAPQFDELWKSGHYRMRPEDVKRMKKYLTRLAVAERKIKATLKMFDNLNQ